jgi:hypothetical protein
MMVTRRVVMGCCCLMLLAAAAIYLSGLLEGNSTPLKVRDIPNKARVAPLLKTASTPLQTELVNARQQRLETEAQNPDGPEARGILSPRAGATRSANSALQTSTPESKWLAIYEARAQGD